MDADDSISFQLSNRRNLLPESLTRNAINFGGKAALHDLATRRVLTYAQLEARVNAAARVLSDHIGLRKGDRIAVLGRNHVDTIVLYYASACIGTIIVPLNFRSNKEELRSILEDCAPALFAVSAELAAAIDPGLFEGRRRLIFGQDDSNDEFCGLIASASGDRREIDVGDTDPAFIMYSGGTTGSPKGVTQGQAGYVALAQNMLLAMAPQSVSRTDSWLMCAPLYHGGGWAYTVTSLYWGMRLYLLREFEAAAVVSAIGRGQGSLIWLVPTMSRRVVDYVRRTNIPPNTLDPLRLIVSAGAPLDAVLRREMALTMRKATILDMVGQTEATSTTIALSEKRDIATKPNAVGLPVPGIVVALLDEDNKPVGVGEIGEICYRGAQLMLGYWNKPEATAQAMAGGWFHSGDLGRRDDEGVIFLVGRKKDIIKSGGETIVPNEVEDVLREVAGVQDACVIGLKDDDWGERVHAVVACSLGDSRKR